MSKTWFKSLTHCNIRPLWVPYGNPTHRQLRNRMTHSEKSKDTQNNMRWFPCMHSVCFIYGNLICVVLLKQKIQSGFSTNFSKNIQLVISICSPEAQQWTNTMQEKRCNVHISVSFKTGSFLWFRKSPSNILSNLYLVSPWV